MPTALVSLLQHIKLNAPQGIGSPRDHTTGPHPVYTPGPLSTATNTTSTPATTTAPTPTSRRHSVGHAAVATSSSYTPHGGCDNAENDEAYRLRKKAASLEAALKRAKTTASEARDALSRAEARLSELEHQHGVLQRNSGIDGVLRELSAVRAQLGKAEAAREAAIAELRLVRETAATTAATQRAAWEAKMAELRDSALKLATAEVKT